MDIENLNKNQIVLLTLLVSFITSIATGIVTVTLMDQAPPAMVQTIHKVVEKTVETVTPNTQVATVQKEVVIIKEQNLIAEAVAKNSESFVRIYEKDTFAGLGVIIDKAGIILTSSKNILKDKKYSITMGEKSLNLELLGINTDKKIAYFKIVESDGGIFKTIFKTSALETVNSLKLGQSVFALNGIQSTEVLTGIISSFVEEEIIIDKKESTVPNTDTKEETNTNETQKIITAVKTNISDTLIEGSPLINLEGKVIGINVDSTNIFITLDFIKNELKNLLTPQQTDKTSTN